MAKYVGKRVVPKHCGAWTKNKEYEMLSIVLDEASGESYISRRVVPAGTLLTDEYYWSICSLFSQQIADMGEEFEERQNQITQNNANTLAAIRQDNDATEQAIRDDNDATEQAVKDDNTATKQHVEEVTGNALAEMNLAKQSFNQTSTTLTTRMDSIAGSATEETEVLDARVDIENTTHENLGSHIRSVGAKLNVEKGAFQLLLDLAESAETEDAEFGCIETAVIDIGGEVKTSTTLGNTYRVSDAVEVEPGAIYRISACGFYRKYLYAFYDADGNFLEGQFEENTVSLLYLRDKLLVAPLNAATLRIAWVEGSKFTGEIGKVTAIIFPTGRLTGELLSDYEVQKETIQTLYDNAIAQIGSDLRLFEVAEDVELNDVGNALIDPYTGEIKGLATPSQSYRVSDFIPVTALEVLRLTASSHFGYDLYGFYDAEQKFLRGLRSEQGNDNTTIEDELLIIPNDVAYIRIAWRIGTNVGKVERLVQKGFKGQFEGTFTGEINASGTLTGDHLKWSGKKWVVVGDSHTEHNIRATKNYHDYVAEKTGITVVNLGKSGAGYKRLEESNKAFYQLVASIPEDADVVTIYGSGNDLSQPLGEVTDTGTDTLCGCINTTIDNYNELFPGTPLGIVTPCPWSNANPANENCAMALYSAAIVEICKRRSIPCLDLYHCSNLRPWEAKFRELFYTRDNGGGCHPDENGHAILAPKFAAFLEYLIM